MVLLIDNYDSFTYNLYQLVASLGYQVTVAAHDAISLSEIEELRPEKIIISPGPKGPSESGISCEVIERFHPDIPILGVCLGHQCIGAVFGIDTIHAQQVMHGKTSPVQHVGTGLFTGLPQPLTVARYHSLALERLPEGFTLTAWSDDGEIMGMQHTRYPLYGIQFHPESFMTPDGAALMKNFLNA